MSDGLAELLGSEVRSLEEASEFGAVDAESEDDNSKENLTRRYAQCHQAQEASYPAIKLTFKDSVNISQLKTIKVQSCLAYKKIETV